MLAAIFRFFFYFSA
ncbi:pheST operon leader peptide PheM [Serratia marcescens]|nr:pheST operon leader peptide PheM [Serratia marcescens]MBH2805727.1 pheST operon leader peptide PheM [Serratia marcescens]MBH2957775.1 pheST operon leader peptide PheM [Serratia marcescens]MBN5233176.1 pheST operon leader peptide PheM [Serratia marcescens]MBN5367013.1 pheST operon leader peptide PheM [Serratia marcescens]